MYDTGMLRPLLLLSCFAVTGCGGCGDDTSDGDGDAPGSLEDYYPDLPAETGEAQAAFAGQVTDPSQLVTGPAVSGLVGDYFIKNDKVSFIVQSPTRVIGVLPQGGNVVDAVLTSGGTQTVEDHFGELGLIYLFGRTCEPTTIEVVRDGAGGGVAVLRAVGKSGNNEFINIKGIGVLPVESVVDPDIPDEVFCATTYILAPGSTTLEVHHSLYNDGDGLVQGPMGTIADTGGQVEAWTNARGFERASIDALASLDSPQPSDYTIYQGPGVAYGVIPRHPDATEPVEHTQALIAGVSIILNGATSLLDILDSEKYFLRLESKGGLRQQYDLVVGTDGADIDEVFRTGQALRDVSGRVTLSNTSVAVGGRVGVFLDGNGNGMIDDDAFDGDGDDQPDDRILSYMDVQADGTYSGKVPTTAGNLLLRAEVKDVGRSPGAAVADTVDLVIPAPVRVDFNIVNEIGGEPIPARLLVIGTHPAFPDKRVFETYDRIDGVVGSHHAIRGQSTGSGEVDAPLYLPAAGTYRVYVSRGTEWSIDSEAVTGTTDVTLSFRLRQVSPTPGYIASDWHVHQIGSPDSNVPSDERIRSAVSAGIEMFAITDHDYISNLQPLVEDLGLQEYVRAVNGLETTPFAYGHFNSWPYEQDVASASFGAIDWARGATAGFAMLPREILAAQRARGARMMQINHPRGGGFTAFQSAFERANLVVDYTTRSIIGDYANASLPNSYLRLPEESLWSPEFNGLEVWNGSGQTLDDTDADGQRENVSLDRVMRDWFAFLSLGLYMTPTGNSDTHTSISDAVGIPRTYVRVADDSASGLAAGTSVAQVLDTQTGMNSTPRDIVITNGPMITVAANGQPALGRVIAGPTVTLTVTLTSPDWAEFDTLELFANTTPDRVGPSTPTSIVPLQCWTSRDIPTLSATDPCALAPVAPAAMTVELVTAGVYQRYEATVTVTLDAADIVNRMGATGSDAWLVFRVRGDRAVFPLFPTGAITSTSLPALLSGDFDMIRAALAGRGVPAEAFTAPVFVDFDGGGYRAVFAPN